MELSKEVLSRLTIAGTYPNSTELFNVLGEMLRSRGFSDCQIVLPEAVPHISYDAQFESIDEVLDGWCYCASLSGNLYTWDVVGPEIHIFCAVGATTPLTGEWTLFIAG